MILTIRLKVGGMMLNIIKQITAQCAMTVLIHKTLPNFTDSTGLKYCPWQASSRSEGQRFYPWGNSSRFRMSVWDLAECCIFPRTGFIRVR